MDKIAITDRINAAIRFFIYLLVFWLPYSSAVVEICVIASFVLWFIKRIILMDLKSSQNLPMKNHVVGFLQALRPANSFINQPIYFFIFAAFLSVVTSAFFGRALHGFSTKTLEWFVIYFLVLETFSQKKHIKIALAIFLFSAFFVCLDSIIQFYILQKDVFSDRVITRGGATAAFKHANSLGGYLVFIITIVISMFFIKENKRRSNILLFFVFAAAVWSLVITFSRGAWIASFFGIIFFVFLSHRKWLALILGGAVTFTILFLVFMPFNTRDRLRVTSSNIRETVSWRLGLWEDSLKMIKQKPLTGHGLNTYMTLFQNYRRKFDDCGIYDPTYAHNCYIQITAETGILGLTGFLWIIARLFRKTIQEIREHRFERNELAIVLAGLLSGILAFLIHSFVDTNFYSLQLSSLFWCMVGLLASAYKLLNIPTAHDINLNTKRIVR